MCFQFTPDTMTQVIKKNTNAFTTGKFESWNKVAIPSDDNDDVHTFTQSQTGNVEANAQIHAFLLQVRHHVLGCGSTRTFDHVLKRPAPKFPAMNDNFSAPDCEVWFQFQGVQQTDVLSVFGCGRQVQGRTINWVLESLIGWRRVIKINAQQIPVFKICVLGNALTFLFNIFSRRKPFEFAGQFFRHKTAVQENGILMSS